jgi:hypothetical protein
MPKAAEARQPDGGFSVRIPALPPGGYTVTVAAVATDGSVSNAAPPLVIAHGNPATAAPAGGIAPPKAPAATSTGPAAATFVRFDRTTQGNWQGIYGTIAAVLAGQPVKAPLPVVVTPKGQGDYVWAKETGDVRALMLSAASRIAANWFTPEPSNSFDIDLDVGASPRQVAVYVVDWDHDLARARTETIAVLDAATKATLDRQTLTRFEEGLYAIWTIRGHVVLRVRRAAGVNAVVSGLFVDPLK